jgi:MFS family permease
MPRLPSAWLVILGGMVAALHVGKLPPALPVLRDALGIGLLEAGFLLSLVQLAGMALGLAVGLAADGLGLKRTMVAGLLILSSASIAGGFAESSAALLASRALEGFGFLLASMPAPGLIRRLVRNRQMSTMLGVWGAYMPFGTALAMLCGPAIIGWTGWQGWWWWLGAISLGVGLWLAQALPPDGRAAGGVRPAWTQRLVRTLTVPGPWLVALGFAAYSAQWLAVIGFLPSMYKAMGLPLALGAVATALAAAVNIFGNVGSGLLLQRGLLPHHLLYAGFATMGLSTVVAFGAIGLDGMPAAAVRYGAVLIFSAVGGLIPGTLFSLAVRLAPGEEAVSTTVGWMQQWSALGQFAGPPLVAWAAVLAGGWQLSWVVTAGFAAAGMVLSTLIANLLRGRAA